MKAKSACSLLVVATSFSIIISIEAGTAVTGQSVRGSASTTLVDAVDIESRSFLPGQSACTLGVFLTNATPVNDIVMPLEFRTLTGNAYVRSLIDFRLSPLGRLFESQGGAGAPDCPAFAEQVRLYAVPSASTCSGPQANTYQAAAADWDYESPDALRFIRECNSGGVLSDSVPMQPGTDAPGTANASLLILFDADFDTGTFVIDTVCVTPANHLLFVHSDHGDPVGYTPTFTAGVVTIECGPCRCHADPDCDGVTTVIDVTRTINRALRGEALPCAPYSVGGNGSLDGPTDVNCSGATDIVDVVKMIGVAFRGMNPETEFCSPCP